MVAVKRQALIYRVEIFLKTLKSVFASKTFQVYFRNSSWMMAEQILRIVSAVFVGIYIARYLGPEQFGVLSYVLAVAAFLMAVSRMGMDAVLVRELVDNPQRHQHLMGTAFWIMTLVGVACYLMLLGAVYILEEKSDVKAYLAVISISCVFTGFLTVDYYFQSKVKAKFSAVCKSIVLLLMSISKLVLIWSGSPLVWFVYAGLLDNVLLSLFLYIMYTGSRQFSFFGFFDVSTAKRILISAWPMMLSAISVLIYMRIDQVMIKNMLGMHEVGIYSAATRIYEAWMTLPFVISVSLLPLIIKSKNNSVDDYQRMLVRLFRVLIYLSVAAALTVSIFSEWLMVFAFGAQFAESAPVVGVVMWTSVFAAVGSVSARYFNVEHMEIKFALRTALAAILNVALNFLLIPYYGIMGAAVSTLVCTFFANYLMDWFDKDLRDLLRIKHRAVFGNLFWWKV